MKSLIEEKGFEINIEYLKRFFSTKGVKKLQTRQEKAPFYTLLPALEDTLIDCLQTKFEKDNSYIIFFDDLDLIFHSQKENSLQYLMKLIFTVKSINALFANKGVNAKIVLLLRDDICKSIVNNFNSDEDTPIPANSANIFGSYSKNLNWYDPNGNETDLNIRKFINHRIKLAFNLEKLKFDSQDPWKSLVEEPFKGEEYATYSSFMYILNHTFFRPRDLILFFSPLENTHYSFPLNKEKIHSLINIYSSKIIDEIKNELSNFYSSQQIINIFEALSDIAKEIHSIEDSKKGIPYETAQAIIEDNVDSNHPELILEDIFNRSLIGVVNRENQHIYFKHREPISDQYSLDRNSNIILHKTLEIYYRKRRY